jgi:MFS family permease
MGSVRVRLSIMMFLEYAIWGVWAVNLQGYLGSLESFREYGTFKISMIFMTMAIANILAPFVASQLADRYFSTERFLAFSYLVGGFFLLWASPFRFYLHLPPMVQSYDFLFWVLLAYCLLYAPTVALTNSLAFAHLPNGEKDFGSVRLWGTIGWIVIILLFGAWLGLANVEGIAKILPHLPDVGDCLIVAGVLSLIMAGFSLTLPHTPPSPKVENPLAFLTAIKLARYPSFAVMLVVAFLVSTELQFYYALTPRFFQDEPGKSLSERQLRAGGASEAEGKQMLRLLDKNNNKKLSETELKESADRLTELKAALQAMQGTTNPTKVDALKSQLENSGETLPAGRSAADVASYVVTAVDDTGANAITEPQLRKFTEEVAPLAAPDGRIEKARQTFADNATEKGGLDLPQAWVGPVMDIGQCFEILMLAILPLALARLGFTLTIAIGIAAWAVRYALFALGTPIWLVLASQGLHGFGFGFFFVGCMIYSDRIAPKDIRASAQGIIILVSFGFGMLVSSLVSGPIAAYFDDNWHYIFLAPVAILVLCTIIFLIGFRPMPAVADGDVGKTPVPPADQDLIGATEEQKYR